MAPSRPPPLHVWPRKWTSCCTLVFTPRKEWFFSLQWLQQHLMEAIQQTVESVALCQEGEVGLHLALAPHHRHHSEAMLLAMKIPVGITLHLHTIPSTIRPLSTKHDNLTTTYSFGSVMNFVLKEIVMVDEDDRFVALLNTYFHPEGGWLSALLDNGLRDKSTDIVGGKLVHMTGKLLHYGYELLELSFNGGLDVMLTPHNMYRGYWATDKRTHSHEEALAVSGNMMAFRLSLVQEGRLASSSEGYFFDETMSPGFADVDLCLRAREMEMKVSIVGEAVGISVRGLYVYDIDEIKDLTSSLFNPLQMKISKLMAFQAFSSRWKEKRQAERAAGFLTQAKLTWVIHCGGSQGLEAATILQTLYKYLDVRTLIRRYSFCEHSDTLSGMPAFFNDILDYTAYRSFTKPFKGFSKLSRGLREAEEEYMNRTFVMDVDALPGDDVTDKGIPSFQSGAMNVEDDNAEDGSIVLYARDYREMGRWIPRDTSYLIGRYMYETDSLPRPWANHCNQLDEIWVPSAWQRDAFHNGGVRLDKMEIMGETVDEYYFDPYAVQPLALPGTKLDGHPPPSSEKISSKGRPFSFCAVFKMEDRKGYKELVEGYMKEFANNSDVVLVLRTYIHSGQGISDENFSPYLIRKEIDDHLAWLGLPSSRRGDEPNATRIEVVSEHLPTHELVSLYASCDAFVLSTHAEGWGLPTHESMIMGLPVITTDFGGSTEFVKNESGLLIGVKSLIPTTGDEWLKGGNWAEIDISSLRQQMRRLYSDRDFARTLGATGKEYVKRFSPDGIARSYVNRIATIYRDILPTIKRSPNTQRKSTSRRGRSPTFTALESDQYVSHGENIAANLDIQFGQTGRFKTCSVRSYKRGRPRKYPSEVLAAASSPPKGAVASNAEPSQPLCDFVILSTWAPRLCGIATFSSALRNALLDACPPGSRVDVVAVKHKDQPSSEYNSSEVKRTFSESEAMSYVGAAQFINTNRYHTALVQYEFGMMYGDHLVCLLRELKSAKVLTTIHTVKINYQDNLHAWVQQTNFMSDRLVVMTHSMRHIMNSFLAVPTRDVAVIPHGGPNLPYARLEGTPDQFFFKGKKIILSNGLIHPMKGLELMIWAMKQVVKVIPDAVYLIHGTPHPSGVGCKEYYEYIQEEAEKSAPTQIFFNNSFASTADLHLMLRSASVYVNAYTDREQSVSGTLAMALGLGTVSVSTPYAYAAELLQNNSGRLVPFNDVDALAEAVIDVLSDEDNRKRMSRNAFVKAQDQTWDNIAQAYIQLANE